MTMRCETRAVPSLAFEVVADRPRAFSLAAAPFEAKRRASPPQPLPHASRDSISTLSNADYNRLHLPIDRVAVE